MAVIDPKDDCVVIRVVYDGAPMAGKTTSVAALGRGLGTGVYSPSELDGRTLYFDWLDYTGGLFEGRRIRCQIVSVPGQATLAPRRRRLLESADVVVFVGDSSRTGFEADRRYLGALRGVLKNVGGPPVGIVVQANKRDVEDATPLEQLRSMLDELELRSAIIESVAIEGTGIRETFVFAVRLALDRVRELMRNGELNTRQPRINSALELLQELQQSEAGALDLAVESGSLQHTRMRDVQPSSIAAQALQEAMQSNVDTSPREAVRSLREELIPTAPQVILRDPPTPALPDATVASGLVWPPIDGRAILHETAASDAGLRCGADGSWSGVIAHRWRLHSAAGAVFASVDAGRKELVQWARLHVANNETLSKQRCIVLAADGQGNWRLWQIVRIENSLRSQMEAALQGAAGTVAHSLLSVARSFLSMAERLSAATCELPLNLNEIGLSSSVPFYLGFMPHPSLAHAARHWTPSQASELLLSELHFTRPTLRARRSDLLAELARMARNEGTQAQNDWRMLQTLVALARE